ncbi:hypothetical protein CEXT_18221, partial [Caerostris extrusa]
YIQVEKNFHICSSRTAYSVARSTSPAVKPHCGTGESALAIQLMSSKELSVNYLVKFTLNDATSNLQTHEDTFREMFQELCVNHDLQTIELLTSAHHWVESTAAVPGGLLSSRSHAPWVSGLAEVESWSPYVDCGTAEGLVIGQC